MENKPIATRTMYCKSCAEKKYPFSGQVFAVFGGTSQKIHLMKADHNQKKGMTPHFIYTVKKDKHFVTIHALCAIHNCGVEIIANKETGLHDLFLFTDRVKIIKLPIKDYLHFITKWRGWTGYNI